MKAFQFDMNKAEFDRFRRFHVYNTPFIEFETGEVVLTNSMPEPSYRKSYDRYGVDIFSPKDFGAPDMYTPDGMKAPKAWFDGIEYLIWDHKTNMIVPTFKLRYPDALTRANVPLWACRFACYWAGEGAYPVGGSKIAVYPPHKFTKEDKEFISEFKAGYSIIVKLERQYQHVPGLNDGIPTLGDIRKAISDGASPLEFLRGHSNHVILQLSEKGAGAIKRDPVVYPYLTTKEGLKWK